MQLSLAGAADFLPRRPGVGAWLMGGMTTPVVRRGNAKTGRGYQVGIDYASFPGCAESNKLAQNIVVKMCLQCKIQEHSDSGNKRDGYADIDRED